MAGDDRTPTELLIDALDAALDMLECMSECDARMARDSLCDRCQVWWQGQDALTQVEEERAGVGELVAFVRKIAGARREEGGSARILIECSCEAEKLLRKL